MPASGNWNFPLSGAVVRGPRFALRVYNYQSLIRLINQRSHNNRTRASKPKEMLFQFDDYVLDVDRRELRRGGAVGAIEPQVK
jgi:hypothetical protein